MAKLYEGPTPFEKIIAKLGGFKKWPKIVQQRKYTEVGEEIMDPVPLDPPIGYNPQPSMFDIVRLEILKSQLHQKHLEEQWETETVDEADDFDVDDEFPMESRWENDRDPTIAELKRRIEAQELIIEQARSKPAPFDENSIPELRENTPPADPSRTPPQPSNAKPVSASQ